MQGAGEILVNRASSEIEKGKQTLLQQIQMSVVHVGEDGSQSIGRKSSFSTATCDSQSPHPERTFRQLLLPSPFELRPELFTSDEPSTGFPQKLHQKAISWLVTVCWSKDLSQECLWSAALLYYSLKSQKKIQKENLQLTLMTCLHLSIKMTESKSITLKELTASSSKQNLIQNIIEMEGSILEAVGFNIVIPHFLTEVHQDGLAEQLRFSLLFVCQILMLKSCQIFFDGERIERIAEMLGRRGEVREEGEKEICREVAAILAWKEAKIIVNKYSSKFDMEGLRMKLSI